MAFNPNEHLMQLQKKDYLEVKWRLVWFRDLCPTGSIETEIVHLDLDREVTAEVKVWNDATHKMEKVLKTAKGYCVCRAVIKDGNGGVGTGTKSEAAVDFNDFIEKAESGAIGRALATLGYGTQFTGDELDEKARIVDSPVDRSAYTVTKKEPAQAAPKPQTSESKPVEKPQTAPIEQEQADPNRLQAEIKVQRRCRELFGDVKGMTTYNRLRAHVAEKFELGDVPEGCMTDEAIGEMWNQIRKLEQKQALVKTA